MIAPGLEFLNATNGLRIKQHKNVLFECGLTNEYTIFNAENEVIYKAEEDIDFCSRYMCEIMIKDNMRRDVIQLYRPVACLCICCCLYYPKSVEVHCPPGTLIGKVVEEWSMTKSRFSLMNANNDKVLSIQGPCITCSCCEDYEFLIMSANGKEQVGKIIRHYAGFCKEEFAQCDNFSIYFPRNFDVVRKAITLGALFLINFLYFEHSD